MYEELKSIFVLLFELSEMGILLGRPSTLVYIVGMN